MRGREKTEKGRSSYIDFDFGGFLTVSYVLMALSTKDWGYDGIMHALAFCQLLGSLDLEMS